MTTLQYVIVDEPKAACKESAFTGGQAIAGIFGFVPQNEFAVGQPFVLDRPKRSADPRIACREKTDERDQQQTRIAPLCALGLHKALEGAVETALARFGMA